MRPLWPVVLVLGLGGLLGAAGVIGTIQSRPPAARGTVAARRFELQRGPRRSSASTSATLAPVGPRGTRTHTSLPAPLATAGRVVARATKVRVLLPATVPSGLSATTTASPTSYRVSLYACPAPQSLDDRQIGSGACGGLAQFFGSVAGAGYASAGAAQRAVRSALHAGPVGCPRTAKTSQRQLQLPGGATVLVRSTRGRACSDSWTEHGWSTELVGGFLLNRGAVQKVAADLGRLAVGHGIVVVDAAGDGDHTSISFTKNTVAYTVTSYHEPTVAVGMALSMTT